MTQLVKKTNTYPDLSNADNQFSTSSLSVRDILYVLFKHKEKILTIFIFIVATVTIGTILKDPSYSSTATILYKRGNNEITLTLSNRINRLSQEEEINSEIEIIKSRPVIERVVNELNKIKAQRAEKEEKSETFNFNIRDIFPLPKKELTEEEMLHAQTAELLDAVEVNPVNNSNVIAISLSGKDPEMITKTVNLMSDAYIDFRLQVHRRDNADEFFDDQISGTRVKLEDLEKELSKFQIDEEILSYQEQESIAMRSIEEYNKALTDVRKEIISKGAKLNRMQSLLNSDPKTLIPSNEIGDQSIIMSFRNELVNLRLQRNTLIGKYKENSKPVRVLDEKIAKTEASLRAEVGRILKLERLSLLAFAEEEKALESTISYLRSRAKSLPEKRLTIVRLERAIQETSEIHALLVKKRAETRITDADDQRIANVKVLSKASIPTKSEGPNKAMSIVLGVMLGGLLGIGVAFLLEYLNHTYRTGDDVEHYLELPLLASIPEIDMLDS